MKNRRELENAVREALAYLKSQTDILEGFVFASANDRRIARVNYASHFPCEGVIDVKGSDDLGISVTLSFKNDGGQLLYGHGQTAGSISGDAFKEAVDKARRDACFDPDFHGLPKPEDFRGLQPKISRAYHDQTLMDLGPETDAELVNRLGWDAVGGALERFKKHCSDNRIDPQDAGFILSGDLTLVRERMAVGTLSGIEDSDETTIHFAFLTAMVESGGSKGSGFNASVRHCDLEPEKFGWRAADNAIRGLNNVRVPSGKYTVVFGPQALKEIWDLLKFFLELEIVEAGVSIFSNKFGQRIASPLLNIFDNGAVPGLAGTKRITCEGYPTRKTELIKAGRLVGYLTDHYNAKRVLGDPEKTAKTLGADPRKIADKLLPAANGFRFGEFGGGRIAAVRPAIAATNVFINSPEKLKADDLLERVDNGLFIGRLWYTYPVGGLTSGLFSGTEIADSFVIRDGKLAEAIRPNTLRITDDLRRLLKAVIGIADNPQPTILWASDEIVYAPWLAVAEVPVEKIGKFLS